MGAKHRDRELPPGQLGDKSLCPGELVGAYLSDHRRPNFCFLSKTVRAALANSSADFDIDDVVRRNREAPETVREGDLLPRLLEEVDPQDALPVTIDPGEVIAFSAQHAHVGIQNHTDHTRISLDTRTLQIHGSYCGTRRSKRRWTGPLDCVRHVSPSERR